MWNFYSRIRSNFSRENFFKYVSNWCYSSLNKVDEFSSGRHVVIGRLDSSLYLLMPRSDTRARECSIIYTKLRHALRMMTGLRCHRSADRLIILANCPFSSFRFDGTLRYSCLRYTWTPSRAFSIPPFPPPPCFRLARSLKRGCIRSGGHPFRLATLRADPIASFFPFFLSSFFLSSQNPNASLVIFSISPIFVRLIATYPRCCNIVKIGSISVFERS